MSRPARENGMVGPIWRLLLFGGPSGFKRKYRVIVQIPLQIQPSTPLSQE
jgi:hypothetical protein